MHPLIYCYKATRRNVLYSLLGAALLAALPISAGADVQPKKWRALPWHLVDLDYRVPKAERFQSVEIDMELTGKVKEKTYLFLSPLWGRFKDKGFYFGFQTDLFDPAKKRLIGKGIVFSRWGLGRLSDARKPPSGWGYIGEAATSGEGDFVSVRRPFKWGEGRYTFIMRKRRPSTSVKGNWMDLLIFEHRTGKWIDAGGLKFFDDATRLRSRLVSFVEIYAAFKKNSKWGFPTVIPKLTVTMGTPLVNGTFEPISIRPKFNPKIPRLVTLKDLLGETRIRLGDIPVPASPAAAR